MLSLRKEKHSRQRYKEWMELFWAKLNTFKGKVGWWFRKKRRKWKTIDSLQEDLIKVPFPQYCSKDKSHSDELDYKFLMWRRHEMHINVRYFWLHPDSLPCVVRVLLPLPGLAHSHWKCRCFHLKISTCIYEEDPKTTCDPLEISVYGWTEIYKGGRQDISSQKPKGTCRESLQMLNCNAPHG